jgi:hypothetical protein
MTTSAPPWPRETPWRQGAVIQSADASRLELLHSASPHDTCVIVVSHDCDIANSDLAIEPNMEVIVGRIVGAASGDFTHGKSPRTLHWVVSRDGAPATIELVATAKRQIEKVGLVRCEPDPRFTIDPSQLYILRSWLSLRYKRAAFPDEFERRLKLRKVDKNLHKLLKRVGHPISDIYFTLDGGNDIDHRDGSAYQLGIVLTFPSGDEPEKAMNQADSVSVDVEKLFTDNYFDSDGQSWQDIQLIGCMAISEDDITVAKAKLMSRRSLEYLSLQDAQDAAASWEHDK